MKFGSTFCVYDAEKVDAFLPEMLNCDYWQQQKAILGSAQGRGTTWFIQYQQQQWVLRHYYRGGMIGKLNKDKYLFTNIMSTRAAREYELLKLLQKMNLPAPKPIAYRVIKNGLFYRADLLSERILNAEDLVAKLSNSQSAKVVDEKVWENIGRTIRQFHDKGIYHHDLNAHNILIDKQNKIWLIDFDQGEQRINNQMWQQANMSRLLRSFNKEKNKSPQFHWHENYWQALLKGYDESNLLGGS